MGPIILAAFLQPFSTERGGFSQNPDAMSKVAIMAGEIDITLSIKLIIDPSFTGLRACCFVGGAFILKRNWWGNS